MDSRKLIYFLLSCDEQKSFAFLQKQNFDFVEGKSLPKNWLTQSKKAFTKKKQGVLAQRQKSLKKNPVTIWQTFCHKSCYEEVLPLVLCKILKIPKGKAMWLLKLPSQTLAYRLKQGLLTLEEELKATTWENNLESFFNTLNQDPIPKSLKNLSLSTKKQYNTLKYFFLAVLFLVTLCGLVWIVKQLSPSTVILHKIFYEEKF